MLGEGQSAELDLCCVLSRAGLTHTCACMHEYLMHLLMEVRENNIQFLYKTVTCGWVGVMYVYLYMVACVCLM